MTNREVMTLARQIARRQITDEMRKCGLRISLVEMGEVVRASNLLFEFCRDKFMDEARAKLRA